MKLGKRGMVSYGLILVLTLVTAWWGSRSVTVFGESRPPERSHTIVIDPGHGGVDGGAVSCTGVPESRLNLQISLTLREILHFLGYRTRMIRSSDISVYREGETIAKKKISDLKERVRMVEETENAVLLSIHQNHFPDGRYSGAQVFYGKAEGSQALAEALQRNFITHLNPGSSRRAKPVSGVYLMERITCPGVLIECGFLSNVQEEAKLRSKAYQQKLCCVIAATAAENLSNT